MWLTTPIFTEWRPHEDIPSLSFGYSYLAQKSMQGFRDETYKGNIIPDYETKLKRMRKKEQNKARKCSELLDIVQRMKENKITT